MATATQPGLLDEVRPLLLRHEGYRLGAYPDTKGLTTVGIGCNLDAPGAQALLESCGANFKAVYSGQVELTPEQCDCIFNKQVIAVIEWLTRYLHNFAQYSVRRQAALVDLAFNLGQGTFQTFHDFISLVQAQLWADAANDLLRTKAARQTGQRYLELAQMLIEG